MSELVYRRPCEHGEIEQHYTVDSVGWRTWCDRGSETVLDPDKVLWSGFGRVDTIVADDVLAWLDGEEDAPAREGLMGSDLPRRQPGTIAIEDLDGEEE